MTSQFSTTYGGRHHFVSEITVVYATWRLRRLKLRLRKLFKTYTNLRLKDLKSLLIATGEVGGNSPTADI
ncbi:MAG: hypothetical protein LBM93_00265 [Oscillospiraceae bacterium]|nr:hypothetical protein [Oscillospiraceae bacterium]